MAAAPRWHRLALAALLAVGVVRGLYWVALVDVWRADEPQHYSYVEDLATQGRLPLVGTDLIGEDAAALYERSPTNGQMTNPATGDPADPRWGAAGQQYEGGQGPLYYLVLALPYRLATGLGPLERLFVLRTASLLLTLALVPLTWLLARALFPRTPAVWIAAPALLLSWQQVNVTGASLTNDALAGPLAVAALTAVAWAFARGPRLALAAAAGGALGLALLTKASAVVVALPLVAGAIAVVVRHRPAPGRALAWAAVAGLLPAALYGPWLRWQFRAYAPATAVERFNAILAPIIGQHPWSHQTLFLYLRDAVSGLFNHGEFRAGYEPYGVLLLGCLAVAACGGALAALRRRRGAEAFGLLWLGSALPLGFVTMVAVVQAALDGYGTVAGRYLLPALPAAAVAIAGGASLLLGRRAGVLAVALVGAVALTLEVGYTRDYVAAVYLRGLPVAGSAPVVDQQHADAFVPDPVVTVSAPCTPTGIGFAVLGAGPERVEVRSDGGVRGERLLASERVVGDIWMAYYALGGTDQHVTVRVPAPAVAVARDDRAAGLSLVGAPGDPVARVYCPSDDPQGQRFRQLHAPLHPDLPLPVALGWPWIWAAAGWAAVAAAAGWMFGDGRRRAHVPASDDTERAAAPRT